MANPSASFLFPHRWLVDPESKKYLAENIRRQLKKSIGAVADEETQEQREQVLAYKVVISYFYKKPLKIPFTKTMCEAALRPVFPNARCLSISEEFTQTKSKTALAYCDFNLYIIK